METLPATKGDNEVENVDFAPDQEPTRQSEIDTVYRAAFSPFARRKTPSPPHAFERLAFRLVMFHRALTSAALLAGLFLPAVAAYAETVRTLEDFDGENSLRQTWTAFGEIQVERREAPQTSLAGVRGDVVLCQAGKNSLFAVGRDFPSPPYEHFEAIRFRVKCDQATAAETRTLELRIFSTARPARLWRKVELSMDQWQIIELPMRFFRPSDGASLSWKEVSRFGFHFRDPGTYFLDAIELVKQDETGSPYLSPQQLSQIAFGKTGKITQDNHFAVITDDPRVDADEVIKQCHQLRAMIDRDFPDLPKPTRPVPILVFASRAEYLAFWPAFATKFGAQLGPVRSDGFSLLGVAGSYYSQEYGSLRPVLIHEACHAILAPSLGVANRSEWLHEGLANHYQLHWTKQDIHELTRAAVRDRTHRPLSELLDGQRIDMKEYAVVTLFVKWLVEDTTRRNQFQEAIRLMRKRASTALDPVSRQAFDATIDELEIAWLRWARNF